MSVISFSIHIYQKRFRLIDHWTPELLSAPFWRLWWNEQEGGKVWADSNEHRMSPDSLILLSPQTQVMRSLESPTFHFNCHFYLGFPWDLIHDQLFEVRSPTHIRDLISDAMSNHPPREEFALSELVMGALRQLPPHVFENLKFDERIEQAVNYLNENRDRIVSNDELAKRLHMTSNSFIRLFKSQTGLSPQAFHRQMRLDYAALLLLRHTQLSIDEIAERAGFHDRHHLNRAFKRRYHCTASAYRRLSRK
ncbi:MAG: AraC family transcriptional regulator [Lentisphaerae bacterium]|nr:MAG: AraC family transcriptional regulator [Lentisphaerota bacterium]